MAHSPVRGGAAGAGAGAGEGRPVDYARVVKLFTNKHTEGLYDRQVSAVLRVCRKNPDGFLIKDLPQLEEIMGHVAARVRAGEEMFKEPLAGLIVIGGKEYRRSASHEEYRSIDAIVSFVNRLATMMALPDPPLQVTAAESLRGIARGYLADGEKRKDDSTWRYTQELCAKAAVSTVVAEQLGLEVDELASFDADGNRTLDDEEMHRARVTNDADRTNDDEEYDEEKHAPDSEAGKAARPPYFLGLLVKLVWELTAHGENSGALVRLGAPQLMVRLLTVVQNFREPVVTLAVEALWNMLEHSAEHLRQGEICLTLRGLLAKHRDGNAAYLLSTNEAAVALTSLFERVILGGYKRRDKELRNETLIVATLVARRRGAAELLVNSGFLSLLLEYATAAEMELPVDANPRNFATSDPVDLEFKQILWSLVGALCSTTPLALRRVQESLFIQTLLLYLDPSQTRDSAYLQIWAPTQRRILDLLAARLLRQLAPQCMDLFQRHDGAIVALNHVRAHSRVLSTPMGDDGVSTVLHDDDESVDAPLIDDTEDDVDRQYGALRLLQATTVPGGFATQLGDAGAVEDLLMLLSGVDAAVPPPAEVGPSATVTAATANPSKVSAGLLVEAVFGVQAALCAGGHEDNQTRFRRAGGIGVLLSWLRYDPDDAVSKPMAVVSVVAALWEAVAGNRRSEAKFTVEDGVHVLLDLLDACPKLARGQVLGCLADLCHNERAHPYFRAWRSDRSGRGAITVLMALWCEEEERLGIKRDSRGEIGSTSRPLGVPKPRGRNAGGAGAGAGSGSGSPSGGGTPRSDGRPAFDRLRRALKASKLWTKVGGEEPGAKLEAAVGEQDLRSKIFSVLRSLGADFLDEDQAKDYDDLSWEDKVTFCVASRYFNFREGHLWQDLTDEFAKARIDLIKADLIMVEKELELSFRHAAAVKYKQHEAISGHESKLKEDDDRFLDGIKAQKAGEEAAYVLAQQQHPLVKARARAKARRTQMEREGIPQ